MPFTTHCSPQQHSTAITELNTLGTCSEDNMTFKTNHSFHRRIIMWFIYTIIGVEREPSQSTPYSSIHVEDDTATFTFCGLFQFESTFNVIHNNTERHFMRQHHTSTAGVYDNISFPHFSTGSLVHRTECCSESFSTNQTPTGYHLSSSIEALHSQINDHRSAPQQHLNPGSDSIYYHHDPHGMYLSSTKTTNLFISSLSISYNKSIPEMHSVPTPIDYVS